MSPILSAVAIVNEAMATVTALMPLVQQHLSGQKSVTEEDVRAALAGKDAALSRLDAEIAKQEGGE